MMRCDGVGVEEEMAELSVDSDSTAVDDANISPHILASSTLN